MGDPKADAGEPDLEALREGASSRLFQSAFSTLVARYRDRLFRLAVSVLGPNGQAEAEDVVHDVFVRVHSEISKFRGDSSLATWLYRLTYNRAMDVLERARYRRPHLGEQTIAQRRSGDNPAGAFEQSQERQRLEEAIEDLPDLYRLVLRQYYWMEMSVEEIAATLDVAEGTVKSYLFRARKLLAQRLGEERPGV